MPKTLKDLIPVLRDTYRSIDIRAVLAKSKAESIWYSVVLKIRLTKDSRTELKQRQETKQRYWDSKHLLTPLSLTEYFSMSN